MMETLIPNLSVHHRVVSYSTKENKLLRMVDMVLAVIRHRKVIQLIFIDTFSTNAFWYFAVVAMVSRFFKLPYIPVLRGGNLPGRMKRNPAFLNKLFDHASINVIPSSYLKRDFEKLGYPTICIPNFLEIGKYAFRRRPVLKPKLLWVRSFHRIYNPELAIRLVEVLSKSFPDVELSMVGPDKDGSLGRSIQLAKQLGIEERVHFTGKLSKSEWIRLSVEYDIFINTTDYDNTPVSVIEAMALGLPVVSTNVGGIPDLIASDKDGLLVTKNDPEGFRLAIVRLLETPAFGESLSIAARQKAESFSWENVAPLWDAVIEKHRKKG